MGLQFEWDEEKEKIYIVKHGIDFKQRVMCLWIRIVWSSMM